MVCSGCGGGGGQSRSVYCCGELCGPFHTGFFSLHCELEGEKKGSNSLTKMVSQSSQGRVLLSLAFRKPCWALTAVSEFEEEVCGFESCIWLSLSLKTFYLNLRY